jgi:hypothetical protein
VEAKNGRCLDRDQIGANIISEEIKREGVVSFSLCLGGPDCCHLRQLFSASGNSDPER